MTKNCGVPSIGKINCTLMAKSSPRFSETKKDSLVTLRFSTVERSRRGYIPPPWPDAAGLVEIRVMHARGAGSDVCHKPISGDYPNYSHSEFTAYLTTLQAEGICQLAEFLVSPRQAELP
jgi:hypothetical protein